MFLDELPEFDRKVLEVLREPLESGEIHISRAAQQVSFPAKFQLIAAMNPCPCGYYGNYNHSCTCTIDQVQRYRNKLSGPLLDRIDLYVEVSMIDKKELFSDNSMPSEASHDVQERVCKANELQHFRQGSSNHHLSNKALETHCNLEKNGQALLLSASEKMKLSPRAFHRTLRVSRTIADLNQNDTVNEEHIAEALSFRRPN